ncbi:DUF6778 family protein [Tabrizicola sp.]|uniref:DUF6778 family protein n=1 Tax=Tabrizicola sp. TaxID=2005166 RepID=UPI002621AD2C|nr:DUF6778 family protein [Tabrizicola sp.]MDM7930972.1 hypothetical protein [Tabrizicola sp.]
MSLSRRLALVGLSTLLLSACVGGGGFMTDYDPVSPEVARNWRLGEVRVNVPSTLVVSEQKSLLPTADIVWREDPLGDRYAQVALIMKNAITLGAQGLNGSRLVIIDVTVTRFHALTFEAETRLQNAGVHNINFTAQILDARTGEVLLAPTDIRAELPALSGDQMRAARAKGQTQKSMISAHVARTVAGWLGTGPDNRGSFTRSGN